MIPSIILAAVSPAKFFNVNHRHKIIWHPHYLSIFPKAQTIFTRVKSCPAFRSGYDKLCWCFSPNSRISRKELPRQLVRGGAINCVGALAQTLAYVKSSLGHFFGGTINGVLALAQTLAYHVKSCPGLLFALPFSTTQNRIVRKAKAYPYNPTTLGEHLLKARLDRQLTKKAAAAQMGVCPSTIELWETNRSIPDVRSMKKVTDFIEYYPLNEQKTLEKDVK